MTSSTGCENFSQQCRREISDAGLGAGAWPRYIQRADRVLLDPSGDRFRCTGLRGIDRQHRLTLLDGEVGINDFLLVLANWGSCP